MNIERNIQTVKDFFAAIVRGDSQAMLAHIMHRWQEDVVQTIEIVYGLGIYIDPCHFNEATSAVLLQRSPSY